MPAKLWNLLDEIPRESRRIFVLFHIEGSSCEEIARFLGLAEESVRAHLSRAEGHVRERAPWIKLAELTVSKAPPSTAVAADHGLSAENPALAAAQGEGGGKRQDERRIPGVAAGPAPASAQGCAARAARRTPPSTSDSFSRRLSTRARERASSFRSCFMRQRIISSRRCAALASISR